MITKGFSLILFNTTDNRQIQAHVERLSFNYNWLFANLVLHFAVLEFLHCHRRSQELTMKPRINNLKSNQITPNQIKSNQIKCTEYTNHPLSNVVFTFRSMNVDGLWTYRKFLLKLYEHRSSNVEGDGRRPDWSMQLISTDDWL